MARYLTCCDKKTDENGEPIKRRSFSWRMVLSWTMIDFSNSLCQMIVGTLYPPFILRFAYAKDVTGVNSLFAANLSYAAVTILFSPIMGVLSDYYYLRLQFTGVTALIYGVCTCLMYLVTDPSWRKFAIAMFYFVSQSFRFNEAFVSSFLPSLCNDRDAGFISGIGYFIGSLSSTIILAIIGVIAPERIIGFEPGKGPIYDIPQTFADRGLSMLVTGIAMLLSVIAPLLMLDNGIPPGEKRPPFELRVFGDAFKTLGATFKTGLTTNKVVTLILFCYFFFGMGGQQYAIHSGQIFQMYGSDYGFNMSVMTKAGAVSNGVTGLVSLIYGLLAFKLGYKPLIIFSASILTVMLAYNMAWLELGRLFKYEAGKEAVLWVRVYYSFMAFAMGPIQSLLRGAVVVLTPPDKKCEVFGIMEMFQLLSTLLSMLIGRATIMKGYRIFTIAPMVFITCCLLFAIFTPLGKAEKEVKMKMKKYEGLTLDEMYRLEKQAEEEGQNVIQDAAIEADTSHSSSPESSRSLVNPNSTQGEIRIGIKGEQSGGSAVTVSFEHGAASSSVSSI